MKKLPPIRNENIVVQEAGIETLVYDLTINKAYCLNETSSKVYAACGANQTFETLKAKHKFTDDLIHFTLGELAANNLISEYQSAQFGNLSRREVIKRVGLTCAAALPLIVGLTAPKAVHAQSCAALGAACNNNCCAPNSCTTQFGSTACRAPSGQPCDFNFPDYCLSGACGIGPNGTGPFCF